MKPIVYLGQTFGLLNLAFAVVGFCADSGGWLLSLIVSAADFWVAYDAGKYA